MLTKEKKESYIHGGYNCCPYCDSTEVESGRAEKDDNWAEAPVKCNDCGEEWTDVYTLVDIKESS